MLVMKNINKIFLTQDIETQALSNISFTVNAGEFVAITGQSGSGKTTLLNIAGLLEVPDSGFHQLNGHDVSRLNDGERSRIRREMIGFIFQNFNLLPDLNIADNIQLPLRLRGLPGNTRCKKVTQALSIVGLSTREKHYPSQLSGGQQQRAAIARAIAGDPKLILADEPTGNLDSTMSAQVMELLGEINNSGTTIVMVTHNESHANIARHRIDISDGQIKNDINSYTENEVTKSAGKDKEEYERTTI